MPLITTEYDPKVCQCCGYDATASVRCVCDAFPEWHLDENGEVACGYHKADMFVKTERKTIAMGVKPIESNDRWRNFR